MFISCHMQHPDDFDQQKVRRYECFVDDFALMPQIRKFIVINLVSVLAPYFFCKNRGVTTRKRSCRKVIYSNIWTTINNTKQYKSVQKTAQISIHSHLCNWKYFEAKIKIHFSFHKSMLQGYWIFFSTGNVTRWLGHAIHTQVFFKIFFRIYGCHSCPLEKNVSPESCETVFRYNTANWWRSILWVIVMYVH